MLFHLGRGLVGVGEDGFLALRRELQTASVNAQTPGIRVPS